MSTRKKVAVITRTKNRVPLLKRALESVNAQTFKDFVWVIVNDGGERPGVDATADEARKRGIETRLVHHEKSLGMEAASNAGIRAGDSDYIVIHDDDDSWDPTFLERTTKFLDSEPLFGGVITHTTRVNEAMEGDTVRTTSTSGFNTWLKSIYLTEMLMCNSFPPISFLYKRSVYDTVGGYNESLPVLGDWDFNIRFLLKSDIGVIREQLANYHFRENITDAGNVCGNTVVAGLDKHVRYDAILRNHYFRTDPAGLGMLANMAIMTVWQTSKANEIIAGVSSLSSQEQSRFEQTQQKQNLLEQLAMELSRQEQTLLGQLLLKCERRSFFARAAGKLKRIFTKK